MKIDEKIRLLDERLLILLEELGEECQQTLKLMSQLETKELTPGQLAHILSELAVSIVHLNAHTEGLQDEINDEIERL